MTNSARCREPVSFEWLTTLNDQDLIGIVALLDTVALASGANGYTAPLDAAKVARLAAKLRYGLASGELHQLVVRGTASGRIVGIASLDCSIAPMRRHIVQVGRVVVDPAYRAQFLLRGRGELLRKCRDMSWEIIHIDVSERGPVLLWQRFGFQVFAVVPDYARELGKKIAGYYMTLDVTTALEGRRRAPKPPARAHFEVASSEHPE